MKYKDSLGPCFHAFDFDKYPPSIANLPPALTINGTTVYPAFRYKGGDAGPSTWNPWGYGQPLTLQAGTAPTYNNGSPLLGNLDDSVLFNGGGYYRDDSGTVTLGDVTTEDIVWEIIYKLNAIGKTVIAKRQGSVTGWEIQTYYAGLNANFRLAHTSTETNIVSDTLVAGCIYHIMCFCDRSGSAQIYVNGVASGSAVDISARAASLTNAKALYAAARTDASGPFDSNIYYLAMWKRDAWLDTHLQATVAAERFYRLTGLYPHQAKGTATPTTYTRALAGYLDKTEVDGTTKLYYMGAGWPRSCSRVDANGKLVKGLLVESSVINYCPYSDDYSNHGASGWGASRCSVPTTSVVCPDGVTRTTNTLHEDTTADETHQLVTSTSVSANLFGVFVKAVNRTWVCLSMHDGVSNAYFNLSLGTTGTTSGGTTLSGIQNMGNGWYLCWMTAPHGAFEGLYIRAAEADNDNRFNGLDQDSLYVWGARCTSEVYPSSHIPTTAIAATRPADVLRYSTTGNVNTKQGQISCNVLCPNYNQTAGPLVFQADDVAGNNYLFLGAWNTGDDFATFAISSATAQQALITTTTDLYNNTVVNYKCIYKTNCVQMLVNNSNQGTIDTSANMPVTLSQLTVGGYSSTGYELNGLINNFKAFESASKA